jgi:hypothetical protein
MVAKANQAAFRDLKEYLSYRHYFQLKTIGECHFSVSNGVSSGCVDNSVEHFSADCCCSAVWVPAVMAFYQIWLGEAPKTIMWW